MSNIKKIIVWVGNGVGKQVRPNMPKEWLLWYRKLEQDLLDYSGNWKHWTRMIGGWWFQTIWGKKWAIVTRDISWNDAPSTQYIQTSLQYGNTPLTMAWWLYLIWQRTSWNWAWSWLMQQRYTSWLAMIWWRNWYYEMVNSTSWNIQTSTSLSLNSWHFVCATFEWNTAKMYVDGELINTTTMTLWWWTLNWYVELWRVFDTQWTQWYIRHCAVYNRALSADEVLEYYNNTK